MIGLLWKDFCLIKKSSKIILMVGLFYGILSIFSKTSSYFSFVWAFIGLNLVITTFSYDEYNKWDKFAAALPLSRKDIVKSKYFLSLLLIIVCTLVSLILAIPLELMQSEVLLESVFMSAAISFGICCIYIGIYISSIYRFGVERSRNVFLGAVFIPILIGFLLSKANIPIPSEEILEKALWGLTVGMPLFGLLFLGCSYLLSCWVYTKKDL